MLASELKSYIKMSMFNL